MDDLRPPYDIAPPHSGEIVLIVGEPGMGKTQLAIRLLRSEEDRPTRHCSLYLGNGEGELDLRLKELAKEVTSRCRNRGRARVSVLIDAFPSVSEDLLSTAVARMRAFAAKGCLVAVTLRPEAEQLVEALPEARVVGRPDLAYSLSDASSAASHARWELTHGIPLLVRAVGKEPKPDAHYLDTLMGLICSSYRVGVPQSEREARVAMMLLGSGRTSELAEVVPSSDAEMLAWLEREAPLFGIHLYEGSFRCAGLSDDEVFRACLSAFRRLDESFSEVITRSYEVLLSRRSYARAGMCCSLIPSVEIRSRRALRAGVELTLVGSAFVVRDAVEVAGKRGLQEESGYAESRAALQMLEEPYDVAQFAFARLGVSRGRGMVGRTRTHIALLMGMRRIDAGQQVDLSGVRCSGPLAEALVEHMAVCCLLFAGRATDAVERLADLEIPDNPSSIPEALLAVDRLVGRPFGAQEMSERDRRTAERAIEFVERSNLRRLCCYLRAALCMAEIVAGGTPMLAIDRAVHQAEASGDSVILAVFLLAKGIYELRIDSPSTAHVCFSHAAAEASGSVFTQIGDYARFLDAVTLSLLGEEGSVEQLLGERPLSVPLADVAYAVASAERVATHGRSRRVNGPSPGGVATGSGQRLEEWSIPDRPSRDVIWLVALVARDFDGISERFTRSLPRAWRDALKAFGALADLRDTAGEKPKGGGARTTTLARGSAEDAREARKSPAAVQLAQKQVRIALLGGFRVSVNGRPLLPGEVRRRRADELMALLAVRESHSMRREEIVSDIWGREDFERALQRLYEATSASRNVLGARKNGFDPFVLHKGEGVIGLNTGVVACDLDEFEDAARSCTLSSGADEEVVEQARRARELYVGCLDSTALPDRPWIRTRSERLRTLFIDAMVAGSRSALKLGMLSLALAYAQSAAANDEQREDVVAMLMRCLALSDRADEARDVFERFSYHITSTTRVPPSIRLRRLANELVPSGRESYVSWEAYDGVLEEGVEDSREGAVLMEREAA